MILHLSRMRRNVTRNVYNNRKNVSVTPPFGLTRPRPKTLTEFRLINFYPWIVRVIHLTGVPSRLIRRRVRGVIKNMTCVLNIDCGCSEFFI